MRRATLRSEERIACRINSGRRSSTRSSADSSTWAIGELSMSSALSPDHRLVAREARQREQNAPPGDQRGRNGSVATRPGRRNGLSSCQSATDSSGKSARLPASASVVQAIHASHDDAVTGVLACKTHAPGCGYGARMSATASRTASAFSSRWVTSGQPARVRRCGAVPVGILPAPRVVESQLKHWRGRWVQDEISKLGQRGP